MQNQVKSILIFFAFGIIMYSVTAQRPSYAGIRPSGLSQKDKYRPTASNVSGIDNRFGGAGEFNTTTIAFGAVQRPPVGADVVMPEGVFVPLPNATPQFTFDNRIGATDSNPLATGAIANNASMNGFNTNVNNGQAVPLPLDAHGDTLLIEQLNRVPEDKRPFWFLNYQAIEAHRNGSGSNFAGAIASRGSFLG